MSEVRTRIEGMSCGHCVAAVERALEGVPGVGVRSVSVGEAVFDADDRLAVDAAVAAIREAGFEARISPPPRAGGSGCCGCCAR